MAKKTISVEGKSISLLTQNEEDFISLTDIAKFSDDEPRFVIRNWLSTQNTIAYLGAWETLHNPNFNRAGFRTVKDEFFEKPFSLTPSKWIESTGAIYQMELFVGTPSLGLLKSGDESPKIP